MTVILAPSRFQEAIYQWVENGQGNALVASVAGSGKTSVLVEAAKRIQNKSLLFCAFNKHIVTELQARLPVGTTVSTIHSIGLRTLTRAIGRCQVDDFKYSRLVRIYLKNVGLEEQTDQLGPQLQDLIKFTQLSLTDPLDGQAMDDLIAHYGLQLDEPEVMRVGLPVLLHRGELLAREQKVISFSDMLWLPHVLGLSPQRFDWVLVDEAQDLSASQLDLVLKCKSQGGRMLFTADKNQAVMGFAAADTQSVQNIINRTQSTILPLSVCYRCPSSHIELAKRIVPQIEAAPGAQRGVIGNINRSELLGMVMAGDMVICRVTAPLVQTCLELISAGVPARIRGRDIGVNLVSILNRVERLQHGSPGLEMLDVLSMYKDQQREVLWTFQDAEMKISMLEDHGTCQ